MAGEERKVLKMFYNAAEKAKKWGGVLKEGKLVVYAKCKSTFMDQSGNLKDSWQNLQDYVGFDLDLRFPDCPTGSKGEPRDGVTVLGRPVIGSEAYVAYIIKKKLAKLPITPPTPAPSSAIATATPPPLTSRSPTTRPCLLSAR